MSNYQVAFLLCRVISNVFFLNAVLGFIALALTFFSVGGGGSINIIGSLVIGCVVHFFSSTIASTLVGQSAFEGEALSRSFEREPHFRAFVRLGTGLLLVVFGASQLIATVISIASAYSFWTGSNGYVRMYGIFGAWVLSPILQIGLGIYLAFGGALKRLSQSMTGVELASPDESESKRDTSL